MILKMDGCDIVNRMKDNDEKSGNNILAKITNSEMFKPNWRRHLFSAVLITCRLCRPQNEEGRT